MPDRVTELLGPMCKHILDAMPSGVFISDVSGRTLYVNRTYEQLTGLRQEELRGKNVRSLVGEGIFDNILNPEIVRTCRPATHVQQLKNGTRLVLSGFPVFDEDGIIRLVATFARDITLLTDLQDQVAAQRNLIDQISGQLTHVARESPHQLPIYASAAMGEVVSLLRRFAATDATVLILGETGVGKDVFGRYLHGISARKDKVMLKVDCGGISETLTESELFGYLPGAFTGASAKGRAGYFEIADGGTIFLDEIGELPLPIQTRLRLLGAAQGERARHRGHQPRSCALRGGGHLPARPFLPPQCGDPAYPPLRERPEDVRPLAEHFLRQYTAKYRKTLAFMNITLDLLADYAWPGNVRELQNLVHSLVITRNGPLIGPGDLPEEISGREKTDVALTVPGEGRPLKDIVADMEREFLRKAIEVHGSVQKVAALFQVNRSTIFRKLQEGRDRKAGAGGDGGAEPAPASGPQPGPQSGQQR